MPNPIDTERPAQASGEGQGGTVEAQSRIVFRELIEKVRLLIFPGRGGFHEGDWQHDLLTRYPDRTTLVQQRDWDHPVKDEWVEGADRAISSIGAEPIIAVCHSAACHAFDAWAEERYSPATHTIAGALQVAPGDPRLYVANNIIGFREQPKGQLPGKSILVASRNDPWMTFDRAEDYARGWGSQLEDVGDAKHVNWDSVRNWRNAKDEPRAEEFMRKLLVNAA